MKNIIIFSEARTGSNLLCELFFSYNYVRVLNEFFIYFVDEKATPHYRFMTAAEKNLFFNYFNIENKTIANLTQIINSNPKTSLELLDTINNYKVIKVHDFIFNNLNLSFLLDDPETKFILLNRSSKIKQYVSNQVAHQIKEWHSVNTSDIKIHVDINEFLEFKQRSNLWNLQIEKLLIEKNHNYLKLNYEEDLENVDQSLLTLKVSNWLDSNNISSSTNEYKLKFFKKQNLSNLEQIITNYKEIEQHLGD